EGRRRHHCDPFPGRHVGRYVVRRTPLGWEGEPWKSEGGNFSFCSSCSLCRWPQLFGCSGTELNLNWFAPRGRTVLSWFTRLCPTYSRPTGACRSRPSVTSVNGPSIFSCISSALPLLDRGPVEHPDGDDRQQHGVRGDDGETQEGHRGGAAHTPDVMEPGPSVIDESVAHDGEDMRQR